MALQQRNSDLIRNRYVNDLLLAIASGTSNQTTLAKILVPSATNIPTNAGYCRFLHFLSCLPILIATGVASGAAGAPPTNFNIRHAVSLVAVLEAGLRVEPSASVYSEWGFSLDVNLDLLLFWCLRISFLVL